MIIRRLPDLITLGSLTGIENNWYAGCPEAQTTCRPARLYNSPNPRVTIETVKK